MSALVGSITLCSGSSESSQCACTTGQLGQPDAWRVRRMNAAAGCTAPRTSAAAASADRVRNEFGLMGLSSLLVRGRGIDLGLAGQVQLVADALEERIERHLAGAL